MLEKVARAIDHVHQRGVLHRDLKPSNILLDEEGGPRVCDFGLARRVEESRVVTLSREAPGTLPYMAPEQMLGRAGLTMAVDVWAMGAVLYELLTGRPPFMADAPGPHELFQRKSAGDPDPPAEVNDQLEPGDDLAWICLKCLRRDPAERYRAADLAEALGRYRAGKPVRDRETLRQKLSRWVGPFRKEPVEPDYIRRWNVCLRVEAGTILACHAGLYFLVQQRPSPAWVWLWFLLFDTFMGWLIWGPLLRRRRLTPMERNVVQLWTAIDLTAVVLLAVQCPPWGVVDPAAVGRFYATYAALRVLTFFLEGQICWGRFYLVGLCGYAVALLIPLAPDLGPLIYGSVMSGWFLVLSQMNWGAPKSAHRIVPNLETPCPRSCTTSPPSS